MRLALSALVLLIPAAGQDPAPATDQGEPKPERYHFGILVEYFPQRLFQTPYATASSTNPILSYAYFGRAPDSRYWLGLTGEYNLTDRISLSADFFHHQAEYTQLTQIRSGIQDPNSSYDNRQLISVNEDTRADYWDIPFVARYYGLHHSSRKGLAWMKDTYALGGAAYRHVSNIRTGTSTTNADGSTSYNEIPAKPQHTNLLGVIAGAGFKLFEDGKFKSMIEVRYTRWAGYTFQGPAYRSQQNQFQIGLSVTY
jgi:hypothetical protein